MKRRLLQILLQDPDPLMFHAEIVRRNDEPVGYVRAASYGFTLGGAVGLVMVEAGEPVNPAYVADAKWDVEIANTRVSGGRVDPAALRPDDGAHQELTRNLVRRSGSTVASSSIAA